MPRKPVIIRIFRALKRHINRRRLRNKEAKTQHQINEQMMSCWTRRVGWFTGALVVVTGITASILNKTDRTLRDTLVANNRAWVWPEISVGGDLTFEKSGAAKITVTYNLFNTGPAPAIHVDVYPKISSLLLGTWSGDATSPQIQQPSDALQTLRDECEASAIHRARAIMYGLNFGEVIFPNRPVSSAVNLTIEKADIDAALARSSYKTITPQLRFCVTYGFATDDRLRETGRLFDLNRIDTTAPGGLTQIDPAAGNIPRESLRLVPNFLGSSYAN